MRFVVTETCQYTVEAESREEAEELYMEHGPAIDGDGVESPVRFLGCTERLVQEAER